VPVQTTEWDIGTLLGAVARNEIRLPEIQRGYVWQPTQVANLIDSLYREYPTGSLLFWKTSETPLTRGFATGGAATDSVIQSLYLLDGQQRLTALSRAFGDDAATEIVFNVETEKFRNQSAATAQDPRWIRVRDVVRPGASLFGLTNQLHVATGLEPDQVSERLQRLTSVRSRKYHMEILTDFPYEEITEIFVRVNSGGRRLGTSDLALATLSARWPGIVAKLQGEADYWAGRGWRHIDATFLTRALTAAVLGRGLSTWSHARLVNASDGDLDRAWHTVQRGLRDLIPLLTNNLRISHSSLLPSMVVLLPLIVLLGERPNEPLPPSTADAILYWLLVATIRNRYSSATDTKLGQDVPAAREADPVRALLKNLGIVGTRVEVTPRDLTGRSTNSPYFLLSFLVAQGNGARDWSFATNIAVGGTDGQQLEYHHVHPRATLKGQPEKYSQAEINDLANFAFISAKANKKISDRSPADYFPELGNAELAAHYVPLAVKLRTAHAYLDFLAARRELLATAMTALLDQYRPAWLAGPGHGADPLADSHLAFTLYESSWDAGRIVAAATHQGRTWTATIPLQALETALGNAANGIPSDIAIGGESVPTAIDGEEVQVPIGPFMVTGTVAEWRQVIEQERSDALPLSQAPVVSDNPWAGDRISFPATSIDLRPRPSRASGTCAAGAPRRTRSRPRPRSSRSACRGQQ
jgi:hypothetical protein